jgi:acyl-CoA synthetase (AMP-forming)/AMP-acid ligase II
MSEPATHHVPQAILPRSVRSLVACRAAGAPDAVAFAGGRVDTAMTWAGLQDAVERAARWRDELTCVGHRRIGLLVEDPVAAAVAFVSALANGIIAVPLDPGAPEDQLVRQLRATGVTSVVRDDGAAHIDVDVDVEVDSADVDDAGSPAVIMTSSGTTGHPKLIPLSEHQLLAAAAGIAQHHQLGTDDRGYCPLPLFHINALVVGVLSTLVSGGSLVLDRRFSRRAFWSTVTAHEVTWLNLVPAIIGILADEPAPPPAVTDRIRVARSASAPLAPATSLRFERRCGIGVIETYGMTEAASQITANPLPREERRPGSVGLPVGVELRLVDESGGEVATGMAGEVEVRGATVITTYLAPTGESPRLRPATSDEGWLSTGDLGYLDHDGFLYLVARLDDVINRGGEKIYPADIEHALLEDPRVTAAVAVGEPHPVTGQQPVAFVLATVAADQRARVEDDLRRRCEATLSPYMRPARVVVVDTLPKGPTGKIRRSELRRHLQSHSTTGPVPPTSPRTAIVAAAAAAATARSIA